MPVKFPSCGILSPNTCKGENPEGEQYTGPARFRAFPPWPSGNWPQCAPRYALWHLLGHSGPSKQHRKSYLQKYRNFAKNVSRVYNPFTSVPDEGQSYHYNNPFGRGRKLEPVLIKDGLGLLDVAVLTSKLASTMGRSPTTVVQSSLSTWTHQYNIYGQQWSTVSTFQSFWKDLVDFECSKNHNVWRFIPSDNVASLTKRPHPSKNHELPPKLLRVLDYSSSCCVQFWSRWNRSHKCKSSKPLTSCLTSCLGTPNPRASKWAIQGTFGLGCASQEI